MNGEVIRQVYYRVSSASRRTWVSGLVGAGTFVISVGAFTDFLIDHLGTWQTAILGLAFTVVIILLAPPLELLTQFLRSLGQTEVTVREISESVRRHRGLIVLSSIGQGIGSAETAIRYHWRGLQEEHAESNLEQCWIITGGPASEQSATDLVTRLIKSGMRLEMFHLKLLSSADADNPEAVHRLVDEIYAEAEQKFNLTEDQVIADYTGGTKSMTSGMILACTSPHRPLQFMKPRQYDAHGRADPAAGADPVAVDIRFKLVPQQPLRGRRS